MLEIIPAILTEDPEFAASRLNEAAGVVERVHIDIIDGVYAGNTTIEPGDLSAVSTPLNLDYHLMVEEPVTWVERCVDGQADRVIGHIEMMENKQEFVETVRDAGLAVGLAIDEASHVGDIDPDIYKMLDVVLIMSVPAGFGGQKFHVNALDKAHELTQIRVESDASFRICDDGGIVFEWIDDLRVEGVDEVVIGNRVFEGDLRRNIKDFMEAAYR